MPPSSAPLSTVVATGEEGVEHSPGISDSTTAGLQADATTFSLRSFSVTGPGSRSTASDSTVISEDNLPESTVTVSPPSSPQVTSLVSDDVSHGTTGIDSDVTSSGGATLHFTQSHTARTDDVTDYVGDVGRSLWDALTTRSSHAVPTSGARPRLSAATMSSGTFQRHSTQSQGIGVTGNPADQTSVTFISAGGDDSWNLIWMPYVLLTLSLILLLLASFARFHCKNRDRYRKRLTDPAFSTSNGQYNFGRQASRARIVYNTNSISGRGGLFGPGMAEYPDKSIMMASLSPLQDGVSVATANAQFTGAMPKGRRNNKLSVPNGGSASTSLSRVSRGTEPGTSSSSSSRDDASSAPSEETTKWVAMRSKSPGRGGLFGIFRTSGSHGAARAEPASTVVPQWRTNMNDRWRVKRSGGSTSMWSSGGGNRTGRQTRVKMGRL